VQETKLSSCKKVLKTVPQTVEINAISAFVKVFKDSIAST